MKRKKRKKSLFSILPNHKIGLNDVDHFDSRYSFIRGRTYQFHHACIWIIMWFASSSSVLSESVLCLFVWIRCHFELAIYNATQSTQWMTNIEQQIEIQFLSAFQRQSNSRHHFRKGKLEAFFRIVAKSAQNSCKQSHEISFKWKRERKRRRRKYETN